MKVVFAREGQNCGPCTREQRNDQKDLGRARSHRRTSFPLDNTREG